MMKKNKGEPDMGMNPSIQKSPINMMAPLDQSPQKKLNVPKMHLKPKMIVKSRQNSEIPPGDINPEDHRTRPSPSPTPPQNNPQLASKPMISMKKKRVDNLNIPSNGVGNELDGSNGSNQDIGAS
jgi:hypothetical protein